MKSSDRAMLIGLLILGIGALFWFMLLSPKRQEAAKLDDQIAQARSEVDQAEATVAAAQQAEAQYRSNYRTVVTLGKAVPSDSDTPSLITQLQTLSDRAGVEFRELELTTGGSEAPPPPTEQTTTDQSQAASGAAPATPAAAPAPATEASAATLPLGASVGPAGLPIMPYKLVFRGDFFEMADFLAGLDGLVGERGEKLEVGGRLVTVNGFTMAPPAGDPNGKLEMELTMTTYVTPESEGVTAGATPAAPAEPTTVAAPGGTTP